MTVANLFRSAATTTPDADLLGRFLDCRDEPAFAELVRRHGPVVYRVCRRVVGPTLADDAFQATFLVLATRANRVQKAASVGSWLIGVAGRVARQMRKRERPHVLLNPDRQGRGDPPGTADLAAVLDDELTRLPDRLRGPLVACLVQHRTHKQAAAELGESERTLRRRLDEAKRVLRLRLERRGVVPAVAAGLVSGVGVASASVPRELTDRAVGLVFDFLAGGAAVASAPAVIAKGVTMNGLLWKAKAVLAGVAVGLTAVGVGLADEKPKAEERKPPPPTLLGSGGNPDRYAASKPIAAKDVRTDEPRSVVRTKNFVVGAPDGVIARAVANEAEHQRKMIAEKWLGKELPAWEKHAFIEIREPERTRVVRTEKELLDSFSNPGKSAGATTFTYAREVGFGNGGVDSIKMQLSGSLDDILRTQLPHEVTHCVLASHFSKPLPRWADEGIALLSEPLKDQMEHDVKCRELLNAGRGLPLRHLLPMKEYPKDTAALYAQGHSLVRFLLTRFEKGRLQTTDDKPVTTPEQAFLLFVASGLSSGKWDEAVKACYGFDDVDALQEAWIESLRQPPGATKPAVRKDEDRIPPTKLEK